ncbi:LpqB family beta-propeller domain-containing protein [Pseudolysinimonas sp.]
MRRRGRMLLAALVVGGLLAGCVSIPTSGRVQSAPIEIDAEDPESIFLPERPQPGQDPAQILQGFLRAGRGPQNNYATAQEFLAPGSVWSGTERVLVASSIGEPVAVDDDSYSVTLTVIAEVDSRGRYTALPFATTQTLTFDFTRVDGENRIVDPPPGTVLNPNSFTDVFRSYALYFFDPSFRYLVPEVHWFPTSRIADRIVQELVQGQGDWLSANVLQSVFPAGTTARATLDAPGVEVSLNAEVRSESGLTQLRMIQQLRASLASISTVSAREVVVTAGGLALSPAAEEDIPETRFLVNDVFGGDGAAIGTLTGEGVEPLSRIGTRADDLGAVAAVLARDRASLAVLGPEGVSLIGPSGPPVPIDTRAGLVAPTLDPFGFVWTVPADDPGALIATGPDGEQHPVQLTVEGTILSMELSRDGSRLLVVMRGSEGTRLFAIGVVRDADLAPVALPTPFDLRPAGTVVDATWVDGASVGVLTVEGDGMRVQLLPLGGPASNLGTVESAVAIVGGNQQAGLRVLTAEGAVLRPSSVGGWLATGLTASFLGTQQ